MSNTHTPVSPYAGSLDLLQGGSELIDLALTSSRAATAVLKRRNHCELNEIDFRSLSAIRQTLSTAKTSLEFFETSGETGCLSENTFAPQIDITIEIASSKPTNGGAEQPSRQIAELIDSLDSVRTNTASDDSVLMEFLTSLSKAIRASVASAGEVIDIPADTNHDKEEYGEIQLSYG